ncbi:MAG TPA: phosphatidate cytidylyltransferase, partial [Gallionellaceae bacterium]|nr:phosphatidate cytidylyltransferase [Gallionellaceae bacterium]
MLKQRIITALVLVTLLLVALFALPSIGWSVLVMGIVMMGTAEWGSLSQLSERGAMAYWWLTFALMAGIIGFEVADTARPMLFHLFLYVLSALLWLVL